MSNLRQTIEAQAVQFATAIVHALRGASIDELVSITSGASRAPASAPTPAPAPRATTSRATGTGASKATKKAGRLGRRSPEDIARTLENIVTLLSAHPEGLRAEQIKAELGLDTREVPRPINEGINTGVLQKSGQKRATIYFVTGTGTKAKKKK